VTWLQQAGQTFIQAAPEIDSKVANWDLGLGESEVLSWAIHHPGYEAIIDDLAVRKAAKILQIPVRGTLAVIVLAKQMGHISSVKQDLENLIEVGWRISPAVLIQALTRPWQGSNNIFAI
jgi:predicted nucleic acid-binding protein